MACDRLEARDEYGLSCTMEAGSIEKIRTIPELLA